MSHPRTTYRAAALAALALDPLTGGWRVFPAWAQSVDVKSLPGYAVATPSERSRRSTRDQANRTTDVIVIAKTPGADDLEATLDDLSAAVERAVLLAIDALVFVEFVVLAETEIKIDGAGETRIGTLTLRFEVERYTATGQPK